MFTDNENLLYCATQTATFGNFTQASFIGGDSAKQFVLGQNANGLLELVYVGQNNDLYHRRQVSVTDETWGSETSFAGAKAQEVAVALNHNGILEIFYRGTGDNFVPQLATYAERNGMAGRDFLSWCQGNLAHSGD